MTRAPILITAICGMLLAIVPGTALAQDAAATQAEIEAVNRALEEERARGRDLERQARVLSQELEAIRLKLVTAARTTQEREVLVTRLEIQVEELRAEVERRRGVLSERYRQLTGTIGALTGLAQDAPRAFFLYPGTPKDAVRGSILLSAAAPALTQRAAILRDDLTALDAARQDLEGRLTTLNSEEAALADDRAQLEALLAERRAVYGRTAEEARVANDRLRELTERSRDLKELMTALQAEKDARAVAEAEAARLAVEEDAAPPPPGQVDDEALALRPSIRPEGLRPFPESGVIGPPVAGRIVQQYGQETGAGQTARGITVETRPGGTVLAPFDGQVAFAGPFRDLGFVLIIEHDGGYHTVLAGFDRIDVSGGDWVLSGEPVGVMPSTASQTASASRPRLYMEVRRDGQPVNPLRWFTAGSFGISG